MGKIHDANSKWLEQMQTWLDDHDYDDDRCKWKKGRLTIEFLFLLGLSQHSPLPVDEI